MTCLTACVNQHVQFDWPRCPSGFSRDEPENLRLLRRTSIRKALETARRLSLRMNNHNDRRNPVLTTTETTGEGSI